MKGGSNMPVGPRDVPARVIAVLTPSTVRLVLQPGAGLADGGIPTEVPLELVESELRMPNRLVTVTMEAGRITRVRARDGER